jgi:uncharacterized protein YdeI (YjbR/CyaY-like superfamily)
MEQYDSRVDAYIDKSADFAKPILTYMRDVVHEASPLLTETIKWSCPFFEHNGLVCQIAAFKKHCAFGFWKEALLTDSYQVLKLGDTKAGSLGPILTIADLPAKEILINLIRQAIALNEAGEKAVAKSVLAPKTELVVPEYLVENLSSNKAANETFNNFSNSQKKEYVDWILDAKTDATRQKRMQTAVEWLSEGKTRNWKYK